MSPVSGVPKVIDLLALRPCSIQVIVYMSGIKLKLPVRVQ